MSLYEQLCDGDRVRPVMRGYRMECCDCGLIHKFNFHIVDGQVEFVVSRDVRSTKLARKKLTNHVDAKSAMGYSLHVLPIHRQLKRWRGKYSQRVSAKAMGVSLRCLQNWEQGHRVPRGIAMWAVRTITKQPITTYINQ